MHFPTPSQTLAYLSVILAGTLGFLIQPLMGKQLIPFFGGAPTSWIGSLLFFQTALLLGYLWAFWLLTKPQKTQVYSAIALAALALFTFQSPESLPHTNPTLLRVIWTLAKSCLFACIALFSTTLLISGWLARQNQKIPYTVYAVSNLGSLSGLLTYTFFLEPHYPIPFHTHLWITLATLCFGCICTVGLLNLKQAPAPSQPPTEDAKTNAEEKFWAVVSKMGLKWIGLSALACSLMIAATYLIAGEIGSNPMAWTAPFGLYLLAFSLSFTGLIKTHHIPYLTLIALASFALWGVGTEITKGFGIPLLLTVFTVCLVILTKLYHSQPQTEYKTFLLALAFGGSLGGLVSSFLVPYIFPKSDEFFYLSLIGLAIGLASCTKHPLQAMGVIAALFLVPLLPEVYKENKTAPFPIYSRDHLGGLKTSLDGPLMTIQSLATTHGNQDLKNPTTPTSYYSKHSPPSLYLKQTQKPLKVGIIGMSTGTLSAYAKPNDTYTFWDIDPKIVPIAQSLFEYLKRSLGKIKIEIADGRLSLGISEEDYDVLIVDAYSGDAIPPHLLTKEAFEIYKARLEKKNGVLFIHHSTRYSNYTPVLTNTAHSVGMPTLTIETHPQSVDPYSASSIYSVFTTNSSSPPKNLLKLTAGIHKNISKPPNSQPVWTDEFNSALHTIHSQNLLNRLLKF